MFGDGLDDVSQKKRIADRISSQWIHSVFKYERIDGGNLKMILAGLLYLPVTSSLGIWIIYLNTLHPKLR